MTPPFTSGYNALVKYGPQRSAFNRRSNRSGIAIGQGRKPKPPGGIVRGAPGRETQGGIPKLPKPGGPVAGGGVPGRETQGGVPPVVTNPNAPSGEATNQSKWKAAFAQNDEAKAKIVAAIKGDPEAQKKTAARLKLMAALKKKNKKQKPKPDIPPANPPYNYP